MFSRGRRCGAFTVTAAAFRVWSMRFATRRCWPDSCNKRDRISYRMVGLAIRELEGNIQRMSLINDALKRAKETHQQNPRPTPPPDAPIIVTAPSAQRSGVPGWIWVVLIVLLVGFGAFLIGQSLRNGGSTITVAAKTTGSQPVSESAATPDLTPAKAAPAAVEVASAQPVSTAAPTQPANSAVSAPPQTTSVDAVAAAAPAPAPMKLQSIIYDLQNPSAMINGKLLFVGDSFGELRVEAIRRNGVTLVGGGKTNLLSLDY